MSTTKKEPKPPVAPVIQGHLLMLNLNHPAGRFAARAYAYWIMPDNQEEANRILEKVGKEG